LGKSSTKKLIYPLSTNPSEQAKKKTVYYFCEKAQKSPKVKKMGPPTSEEGAKEKHFHSQQLESKE